MKEVEGDLIKKAMNGEFDIIVHGCNCFHTMGAGIAKQIREIFPEAYEADINFMPRGSKDMLGHISTVTVNRNNQKFIIVNAYTQYDFSGGIDVDYEALKTAFFEVAMMARGRNLRIGYPLIGCGLAGGDWNRVSNIIETELYGMDHTLVRYKA